MMIVPSEDDDDDSIENRLSEAAETFVEKYRQGQRPSIAQFVAMYPDLADRLRQLLPTLVVIEELGPVTSGADDDRDSAIEPAVPLRIGDYRIDHEIGRGGMGVVYQAEQVSLGRTVALKLLGQRSSRDSRMIERFQSEARSCARLHHPRIIPVYDVGEADGFFFFAMQRIDGTGLDQILADLKSTCPASVDSTLTRSAAQTDHRQRYYREAARIIMHVAETLGYAHSQGILHRDIKPSNLILDRHGEVWVADFGLAKTFDLSGHDVQDNLTATGDIVGTMRYMAPERLRGWSDPRSDVYALGLTLYELLTHTPAFEECDRIMLMRDIADVAPRPPRKVDARIPNDLETIVLKAIQKEPGSRYQSASAMADDLRNFLDFRAISARRPAPLERLMQWSRRNPVAAALLAVLVVVAISASVQSWRLRLALRESESSRAEAKQANIERTKQLRQSLLEQARSARAGAQAGARVHALEAIRQAAAIQGGMDLRNEAIAAMALMDIRPTPIWHQPSQSPMVVFGPTLEYYLAFDGKQSAVIYDKDHHELQRIMATSYDAQFSPDGRYLIFKDSSPLAETGTETLTLLEWRSGKELLKLGTRFPGRPFDFHPNGEEWAVRTADGQLVVYSLPECEELRRFNLPGSEVSLKYDSSGDRLAFIERGKPTVSTMHVQTGKIQKIAVAPAGLMGRISFNPDGSLIAAGSQNWRSYVWNSRSGELITTLIGHSSEVFAAEFSPRSDLLVTSSWDRSYRIWDVSAGRPLSRLEGYAGGFNVDGNELAFIGGGRVGVLRCAGSEEFRILRGHTGKNPRWCTFSPDGQMLVSSGFDGIRFWNVYDGTELGSLPIATTLSTAFSESGDWLITSSASGVMRWPVESPSTHRDRAATPWKLGPPNQVLDRPTRERRAAINFVGNEIAVASDGAAFVEIFPVGDGTAFPQDKPSESDSSNSDALRLASGPTPNDCRISPDGKWLVVSSWLNRWWAVYDLPQRQLVHHFPVSATPNFAFSPDSSCLVASSVDGVKVFKTADWTESKALFQDLTGKQSTVNQYGAVTFSKANSILAIARLDGHILLLDGRSFEEIARLQSPVSESIYHMEFNRSGTQLAVCINGGVQLWDLGRIRRQLSAMDLDWDPSVDALPPAISPGAIDLKIDLGRLSNAK